MLVVGAGHIFHIHVIGLFVVLVCNKAVVLGPLALPPSFPLSLSFSSFHLSAIALSHPLPPFSSTLYMEFFTLLLI